MNTLLAGVKIAMAGLTLVPLAFTIGVVNFMAAAHVQEFHRKESGIVQNKGLIMEVSKHLIKNPYSNNKRYRLLIWILRVSYVLFLGDIGVIFFSSYV